MELALPFEQEIAAERHPPLTRGVGSCSRGGMRQDRRSVLGELWSAVLRRLGGVRRREGSQSSPARTVSALPAMRMARIWLVVISKGTLAARGTERDQ